MATAGKSKKKSPGDASPENGIRPAEVSESMRRKIQDLAAELLKHPVEWLDHPHPQFGGRTPNQLIAACQGDQVYDLLRCAELGMF